MTSSPPSREFIDLQAALAGEYSLTRELGRGGMGIVYLARDVQLDRDVAIKVLPTSLARQAESRERFLREARTAAGLSHPHIVPIHRVGEAAGFVHFVMSYVPGETLGERLRRTGPMPPAELSRILREVAWALAYAHGRGIVHRDVKPDNILLEAGTGRALVTDFGIAQGGEAAGLVTEPGRIMGTAHFMSPEQAASEPLDGRSDLYALGVVGYLAATGRLPFDEARLPALLVQQAMRAATPVLSIAPGLPPALAGAIDRCLERDAGARFADGEMLARALEPPTDVRPALPPVLRFWLTARNPASAIYVTWSALFAAGSVADIFRLLRGEGAAGAHLTGDIVATSLLAFAPLIPVLALHVNRARRLFRLGYSLADLRAALDVNDRERREVSAPVRDPRDLRTERALRGATIASATVTGCAGYLATHGLLNERTAWWLVIAPVSLLVCAMASNAMEVALVPALGRLPRLNVRDRLWRSPFGAWIARRAGAPSSSRAVDAGAFRATEVALGVAAAELFTALPRAYREHLGELPATVQALEARAAEARAEMESLRLLPHAFDSAGTVLEARRAAASRRLGTAVAALEALRLDLLRLHAGATDLAPLTTLIDRARGLGEDAARLAEAQREVADAFPDAPMGPRLIPTPT